MIFDKKVNKLNIDMDGVLANFDLAAERILGMKPEIYERQYGTEQFWKMIKSDPYFFINLEPMPDMWDLYNTVKHLNPPIITGIPRNMNPFSNQKQEWAHNLFGKDQVVICCRAKEKSKYCNPGDILIDDRTIYKHLWEKAGGIYIVHTSAENSIRQLREMGVL